MSEAKKGALKVPAKANSEAESKVSKKLDNKVLERMRNSYEHRGPHAGISAITRRLKAEGYFPRLVNRKDNNNIRYEELGYQYYTDDENKLVTVSGKDGTDQVLMFCTAEVRRALQSFREKENLELEASVDPKAKERMDQSLYGGRSEDV